MMEPEDEKNHKQSETETKTGSIAHPQLAREESIEQEKHRIHVMLMEPYQYVLEKPGKNVRNQLIDAFQIWFQCPAEILQSIKDIISKLHNGSLLIDDIEDKSTVRRGRPAAHLIYGEPSTINCANYVFFQAMDDCRKLKNKRALNYFLDEMLNLHRGQGLDIYWRDTYSCPTLAEYEAMVLDKTGGLFRLAIRLMQCFSENSLSLLPLVNKLALFFQIRDDYINLKSTDYQKLKVLYEDLTEGKFSFPIIHCVRFFPNDSRLMSILKQRTTDINIKEHAVDWMEQCGSFDYTLVRMRELKTELDTLIDNIGGNPILQRIVAHLCKGIIDQPEAKTVEPQAPVDSPADTPTSGSTDAPVSASVATTSSANGSDSAQQVSAPGATSAATAAQEEESTWVE